MSNEKPAQSLATHAEAIEARSKELYKAPRVSLDDIKGAITYRFDFTAGDAIAALQGHIVRPDGTSSMDATRLLSVCILVVANGFAIVGKSAPASPENFDAEYGKQLAYDDAIKQLWPLMGYALRDRLHAQRDEKAAG